MKLMVMMSTFILMFVALLSVVSASGFCSDSQVIMKLYSSSNTHGAVWDDVNYLNKVCYNDFFVPDYAGSNPHDCNSDGSNIVLTLSSATNAHAGAKGYYSTNVCYKGLSECTVESSGTCGGTGKVPIVYISNSGNAHLSLTPTLTYSAVCCKGEGAVVGPTVPTSNCYELDKQSCQTGAPDIAKGDVGCKAPNKNSCLCSWNDQTNKCGVGWDIGSPQNNGCSYRCVIDSNEQTACSGGSKILSLGAKAILTSGPASCSQTIFNQACTSGSATVPCGGLEENLPFFDAWQVLTCLVSIALIYIVFWNRNSHS